MAVGLGTTTTINLDLPNSKTAKATKLATILSILASGKSLNRFEAETFHDHCLNTTVSILQNGYGILIDRARETVPCLGGKDRVSVNRYWLNSDPENVKLARETLSKFLSLGSSNHGAG